MLRPTWDKNHWLRAGAILQRGRGPYRIGLGPFQQRVPGCEARGDTYWIQPESFFSDLAGATGVYEQTENIEKSALLNSLQSLEKRPIAWKSADHQCFRDQFEAIQNQIESGQVSKAVAYAFESASCEVTLADLESWLARALAWPGSGYVFGYWDMDRGRGCLGLTPELLFQTDKHGHLETMALAGTARDSGHNLLSDPKEREEHQEVIQQIQGELEQFGAVHIGDTQVWQPSQLRHLKTDIYGEIGPASPLQVLQALHPTPALGGAPKSQALQLLRIFEQTAPRRQFGAPFGVVDSEGSQFVVQIRCLLWEEGELFLGSGCGVVRESQWQREWNELGLKRESVKAIMGVE